MHLLFERAMLWELFDTQSNPIELVKIKGVVSVRIDRRHSHQRNFRRCLLF